MQSTESTFERLGNRSGPLELTGCPPAWQAQPIRARVDGGSGMHAKLVIADDYQLMVAAIRLALADAPDMEIVGEAHGGRQLLPLVGRTSPDVVLLDLRMPGMDGLRCLELLRERHPSVKAIIFSGSDAPAAVAAAFARGALAFIQKAIAPADLPSVLRQAVAGNVVFAAGHSGHTDHV